MSRIRSKDTKPEMMLRKYLHRSGFRFRIHYPLPGKPDIVFSKKKVVIFVHGCFWHQHGCKNSVIPKTNTKFWRIKLAGNIKRDKIVLKELAKENWFTKIIWECELEDKFQKTVKLLIDYLLKPSTKLKESGFRFSK